MNVPPFPLNPDVGEQSGNWAWNGARWVASPTTGLRQNVQTFTASGPYMPSPGLVSVTVECIGGGGGGGSAQVPATTFAVSGGGGGSGGYSRKTLPAALVRGGILVTVGDGGAGTSANGGDGTATSFGALCLANGGGGGNANNSGEGPWWGYGGPGGAPGIGDVAFPGAMGQNGLWVQQPGPTNESLGGGLGGVVFGGNVQAFTGAGGGVSGPPAFANTGAGGVGAVANQVAGIFNGGAGGSGICIVTETIVGDRDQPVTEWRPPLDVNLNVTQRPPWPPRPPGPWWPPGWPPGWQPGSPWPPGWGPRPPWQPFEGQGFEGQEIEAGAEPYSLPEPDPEEDR